MTISNHTRAAIAYAGRSIARPRYYANDHSRDELDIEKVEMDIVDARGCATTLDEEGFTLLAHRSVVRDFTDRAAVEALHRAEIVELIGSLSGADLVQVNSPGILRFSEKSADSGALDNSRNRSKHCFKEGPPSFWYLLSGMIPSAWQKSSWC